MTEHVTCGFKSGLEIAGEQAVAEWKDRRQAGAVFSDDRRYRYRLWRKCDPSRPVCVFIMLNPSIANESILDRTVSRCLQFAADWGYGRLEVGNLFGLVSPNPQDLMTVSDPVGFDNDGTLDDIIRIADIVICAWGTHGKLRSRGRDVLKRIPNPYCLGTTSMGSPIHPLYQPSNLEPLPYCPPEGEHRGESRE